MKTKTELYWVKYPKLLVANINMSNASTKGGDLRFAMLLFKNIRI
jgi:hypothetical protein